MKDATLEKVLGEFSRKTMRSHIRDVAGDNQIDIITLGEQAQIATLGIFASEVVFNEHRQTFL